MSDDKLRTDAVKGSRADALLNDETLTEAFASIEREYVEFWKATPARDTDARERLWQAVQIIGKARAHLAQVAASGKLAHAELELITRLGERRKILGIV
jgi:hypothetical protein